MWSGGAWGGVIKGWKTVGEGGRRPLRCGTYHGCNGYISKSAWYDGGASRRFPIVFVPANLYEKCIATPVVHQQLDSGHSSDKGSSFDY